MSEEKKPLTKMEWFKQQLAADELYPSELAINSILAGKASEYWEDAVIDYVLELEKEWQTR